MEQPVPDRHPQNMDVQPRVPVRDVVQVVLEALAEGSVAAPTVDLGPAGYTGFDAVSGHVIRHGLAELLDEDGTLRAWAYKTHVSLEDVD